MPTTETTTTGADTAAATDSTTTTDTLTAAAGADTVTAVEDGGTTLLTTVDDGVGAAAVSAADAPLLDNPGDPILPGTGDAQQSTDFGQQTISNFISKPIPGIGRIVHYWDNSIAGPFPGLVTGVIPDEGLQLTVFRPGSTVAYTQPIPYVDDRRSDGPAWRWPDMPGAEMPLANVNAANIEAMFPGSAGHPAFGVRKDG